MQKQSRLIQSRRRGEIDAVSGSTDGLSTILLKNSMSQPSPFPAKVIF
jgi:hypothetical protein